MLKLMNTYRNYKSHIVAILTTLALNALLIVLLLLKPGSSFLTLNLKSESDEDLSIQFQMLEEMTQTPTKSYKSPKTTNSKTYTSPKTESIEKSIETHEAAEETVSKQNQDTVQIVEIRKKSIEIELKDIIDTTQKSTTQLSLDINKTLKNEAENSKIKYENKKFYAENQRTIKNLKFLYPYVIKVRLVVSELNAQLATMKDNQDKRKLIRKTEKELFIQFEKDVRKMSYSQGKLLLKLIARETNETAFSLIKTYKGGIPATFWYGVGLIFQEDIKAKYDSIGEDALLEKIVKRYKHGEF